VTVEERVRPSHRLVVSVPFRPFRWGCKFSENVILGESFHKFSMHDCKLLVYRPVAHDDYIFFSALTLLVGLGLETLPFWGGLPRLSCKRGRLMSVFLSHRCFRASLRRVLIQLPENGNSW